MGKIIILDEDTSNQIAAGEVIERPSSIIKELIENSIDANAKNIKVEIRRGGISFIRVSDDGEGIAKDDVEMAFERHGTSKIKSAKDLNNIVSMGFRGEALASIASIADVILNTRTKDDKQGTSLQIKGGTFQKKSNIAKEIGTTITIKSIFYNTPARFKFLKNDNTEARYCNEIVNKIALAHPEVAFTYISNNMEIVKTPGDSKLVNTIYAIYGREIANSLYEVKYEYNNMKLYGYIGKQNIARGNRANQALFINSRNIKSIEITKAVEKAYESTLMKNKYPFYVLNIDLIGSMVDVNVHPQKLEVRFSNINDVFSLVYRGVKSVIEQTNTIYENTNSEGQLFKKNNNFAEKKSIYEPSYKEKEQYHEQMILIKNEMKTADHVITTKKEEVVEKKDTKDKDFIGNYKIIGQLFNTYVILERKDDILLLDQHACHERITYESLLKKYDSKKIDKQIMLIPTEIRFSASELSSIMDNKEKLNDLGFEFDQFSQNSIIIRAVPTDIANENAIEVFKSAVDNIDKESHEALYMMACKNSIKANQKLSDREIIEMLKKLSSLSNPFNCPHGRPTIIKVTKYEIEKKFKRIV